MTLPLGFVIQLERHVRFSPDGRELVGGSPTRALFLTPAAVGMIVDRRLTVVGPATASLADRLLEAGMADPVTAGLPPIDPQLVTVVVPVRDRAAQLDRLLASLPDVPTIVVDDASAEPSATAAIAGSYGARALLLPENVGPAGARNAGLSEVTTPYVAFADSDVVVEPGAIDALLLHFADPRVAVAAPRVLGLATPASENWIGRYENARSSLDLGLHPAIVRPRSPVSWVSSTFLVARVDALEGGFDATMRVGEDVDLVWRLADGGWRVRYEPTAVVRHEHRTELAEWMSRKAFYGTGADPLSRRHPDDIAPAVLAPWSAALLVALLAQRRWSLPVAAAVTAFAAGRIAWKVRGRSAHPVRLGARLAGAGAAASVSQGIALVVRHWWPLTLAAALVSRRARRAAVVAAIADVALEYRRTGAGLDPVRFGVARRLDDLAYGFGVWLGALRGRSLGALKPSVRGKR
jgi:mycofactocin system glycosyltransferase